jgi:cyanophycinase-like exopeptidase
MAGPIALVGSGEYTEAMLDVERELLAGRPPKYVQIPTAAAPEGAARLAYWVELGRRQAERLGVEPVPLLVHDRAEADDPAHMTLLQGAGLVYLSGGNPGFLADTLRGTVLWRAIVAAWQGGAALAGCSAGAMVFGDWVPELRRPGRGGRPGLGLLPHLRVIPHFDAFAGRLPDLALRPFLRTPEGVTGLGIDENTALVGGPETWTVRGRQSVWLLDSRPRRRLPVGTSITLPLPVEERR